MAIQIHVAFQESHHASPPHWACHWLAALMWLSWRKVVDGCGAVAVERREGMINQVRAGRLWANHLSRHDPWGHDDPVEPAGLEGVSSAPQSSN